MNAWNVTIIKSSRKTIALQIDENMNITVRAPRYMRNADIQRFIKEKAGWIEKHRNRMQKKASEEKGAPVIKLSPEEMQELADKARACIPERVQYYAGLVGVSYGRITIRSQKTRWGSCSSKGNLNFNCLLMLAPADVMDYVIVHELCHRKEMNHSRTFWAEVERVMPDYKDKVRWLKSNGNALIQRMDK